MFTNIILYKTYILNQIILALLSEKKSSNNDLTFNLKVEKVQVMTWTIIHNK